MLITAGSARPWRKLSVRATDSASGVAGRTPYKRLGTWRHTLGFRGHFASKSRRYSVSLGVLRRARRRAQALIAEHRAAGRPLDLTEHESDLLAADETETTLVIGHWTYAGAGWANEGQTVLATAAAARAREHAQWKAQLHIQTRDDNRRGGIAA